MTSNNPAMTGSDAASGKSKGGLFRVIVASMMGNALEWYDYALYGIMAPLIASHFFPKGDEYVQLLSTYGVFAAGFVARPIGAIFFGWFGDRYGRRSSLTLAILMMAIPTGCIGLLPTYDQIGIWAPVLLTFICLLQGLSLGGEYSGSMTYLVEHAPAGRRGLIGAMAKTSLMVGFLMGQGMSLILSFSMSEEDFASYGWRIGFGVGILIGVVGYYIRTKCEESPVYEAAKAEGEKTEGKGLSNRPMRDAFMNHPWSLLRGFMLYLTVTVPFYMCATYFVTLTSKVLGHTLREAQTMSTINMVLMLIMVPISAWLSDKYGRRKVLGGAALAMLFLTYPLFQVIGSGDIVEIAIAQAIFASIIGFYLGPIPAALVELFPTSVRFSGMSMSYNMAATLFGGTAPMVAVWLTHETGDPLSIAFYIMLCNFFSCVALWKYKDRYKEPLS